jgi:alpha-beta hydrolase superfamily lysophospholipase
MRLAVLAVLLLGLWSASASAETGFVTMDDGIRLQYVLDEPSGGAPGGGWPGVVVMHGLGGSADQVAPLAEEFARHGYAALAFSVRGQGGSNGSLGLAGPRDVADMKAMVAWLEARPEVSDRVGCWGISLGGGECWNAAPSGIFDALVPVATWTDVASALWPQGVAKTGTLNSLGGGSTLGAGTVGTTLSPLVSALLAQRSVAARLPTVKTPVYLFQGRDDWVFDVDQALAAYGRVAGPRKLYVGDFGHPPSTFASADFPSYVIAESVRWFDRWLKGEQNGVERPAVTLASADGKRRTAFAGVPPTVTLRLGRSARAPRALETFGDSTVRVQVESVRSYPRLVAVVLANGRPVTHGAVVPHKGANTIRLGDYVVPIAKGARITVRLGRDGGPDSAYGPATPGGTIRVGTVSLVLRVRR